ncbi:MAG: hypothetical protein AAF546_08135 [Verrucomicrobiota bacterium]
MGKVDASAWMNALLYFLARCLVLLFQLLPVRVAFHLGRIVGWLAWKTLKRRRIVVRKNLEIVNDWLKSEGRASDEMPPLDEQVREVFLRSGANLLAGFTFTRMAPEKVEACLEFEGAEVLLEALAEGRGAIILLAHMGPWEALTQLPVFARKHGIEAPFGAMYRPLNNTLLDEWFKRERELKGTRLFGRKSGYHAATDFVRMGGLLGILSDQRASAGELVTFFGQKAVATPLPGLLGLRTKAPLVSLSFSTIGPAQWRILVSKVEIDSGSDKIDRSTLAQGIAHAMEELLASSPADGFWFHNRFRLPRKYQNDN